MSVLVDVVRAEIAEREERVVVLERELAALRAIERVAVELNGGAAAAPAEVLRPRRAPVRSAPKELPRTTSGRDGLSPLAQRALEVIRNSDSVSPAELANALNVGRPTLTKPLKALRDRGLVVGEGSTNSRRLRAVIEPSNANQSTGAMEQRKKSNRRKHAEGVLRAKVLAAVRDHPGRFSEEALVGQCEASRDDVAFACGQLLEVGKVELAPDGTYS